MQRHTKQQHKRIMQLLLYAALMFWKDVLKRNGAF